MKDKEGKPTRAQRLAALNAMKVELVLVGGRALAMLGTAPVVVRELQPARVPGEVRVVSNTPIHYCAAALCCPDDGFQIDKGLRMLHRRLSLRMRDEPQDSRLVWLAPEGRAPIETFMTLLLAIYSSSEKEKLKSWLAPSGLHMVESLGDVTAHVAISTKDG